MSGYSSLQKTSHWALVLLCAVQFPTGWAIPQTHVGHVFGLAPRPIDLLLHQIHAWSGWCAFGLAVALLATGWKQRSHRFRESINRWEAALALATHLSLCAAILGLGVSGTITMYASQAAAPVHHLLVQFGMGLVLLHIAGVWWHELIRKDYLLDRMLPRSVTARWAAKRRDRRP